MGNIFEEKKYIINQCGGESAHKNLFMKSILTFRVIKKKFLDTTDNKKLQDCSNRTKELHVVHVSNVGNWLQVAKLKCNLKLFKSSLMFGEL